VLLGRFNIRKAIEESSVAINALKIVLHHEWNADDYVKYHGDIAIITMEREVMLTKFINPACLPSDEFRNYSGNGTVVGWGKTDPRSNGGMSDFPRYLSIETVDGLFCFTNDSHVANVASHKSFCAGGKGAGPCR